MLALAAVLLATTVAALSCAGPPDDQARKARSAFGQLRDVAHGEKWAPDEYAAAAASLESADREVRAQNARFFMMRDYTKAGEMYTRAMEDVAIATQAAQTGKNAAEARARQALQAALAAIGHAQAAMTISPVSRDSRASYDQIGQQLDRASVRLDEVRNLIVAEDYKQAAQKADEILEQVTSMLRSVSGATRN